MNHVTLVEVSSGIQNYPPRTEKVPKGGILQPEAREIAQFGTIIVEERSIALEPSLEVVSLCYNLC